MCLAAVVEAPTNTSTAHTNPHVATERAQKGSSVQKFAGTDLGNARRLVKRYGRDLRYCAPWGKWLVWRKRRRTRNCLKADVRGPWYSCLGCSRLPRLAKERPSGIGGGEEASQGYRDEMDTISRFIAECCEIGKEFEERTANLYGVVTKTNGPKRRAPLGDCLPAELILSNIKAKDNGVGAASD